jgi:hypothetical protein
MFRCPRCGAELARDARFCGFCGYVLNVSPDQLAPTVASSSSGFDPQGGARPAPYVEPTAYAEPYMGQPPAPPVTSYSWPEQLAPPPPPSSLPPLPPQVPVQQSRPQGRRSFSPKWLILIVLILAVGGGAAIYGVLILTRPQPLLKVTSAYHVGTTPAGAVGTGFDVSGQHFASNSTVHFQLDGKTLPDVQIQSDDQGSILATLKVTAAWPLGTHTLTAVDASNNSTQKGVKVAIVPPGEAHTPGPNGAPPDDASFTLKAVLQGRNTSGEPESINITLIVTGRPDPAGGTVCGDYGNGVRDDGQPHTASGTVSGVPYQETYVPTCQGSYHGGKLSYTRVITQDRVIFFSSQGQVNCAFQTPYNAIVMQGSFSNATTASGSYTTPALTLSCDNGRSSSSLASQGTWSAQLQS